MNSESLCRGLDDVKALHLPRSTDALQVYFPVIKRILIKDDLNDISDLTGIVCRKVIPCLLSLLLEYTTIQGMMVGWWCGRWWCVVDNQAA